MSRIKFYQKYFKNISPSIFDVVVNGDKIEISGFDNSEYSTSNHNIEKIEDYNLLKTVNLEKGGQTNFNPDGIIKNKIVHASGKAGGMLVGKRHSEGGIKAVNKSTGQPIEMEGGEVVITRNAVSDNTKRSFNGKMLTNREILSSINESGGGVSFADGGEIPNDISFDVDAEYEYGGKTMCGKDLLSKMAKGGTVDDDTSDLISSVEALNSQFESGGVLDNFELLKATLPLSSGKGKDRILISIYGNNVSGELLHIQFGNNKTQPLSNNVVSSFFNIERGSIVERVQITGESYRNKGITTTVFSFMELIEFFENQTVEGDWIFEFIPQSTQALLSMSTDTVKITVAGKLRKPIGRWKPKYYFGQKNIKSDVLSFFEKFIGNSFYLNLIPFVLGNTPVKKAIDDLKQQELLAQQEKEKKEKEQAELLDKYLADTTKTAFFNENPLDKDLIEEKNILLKLLPSFDGVRFSNERALIFKELNKIENNISNNFLQNLTDDSLFSDEGLLSYYFTQTTQSPVQELDKPCELPTFDSGKSKLPYGAYLNVRTEQFKKWFGDWEKAYYSNNYVNCSIAIDNNFEPKIFYHGVRRFNPNIQSGAMGSGITRPYGAFTPSKFPASYFSDKKSYAEFYSGESENLPKSIQSKGFIYPVFLRILKPLDIRLLGFECSYNDFIDYIRVITGIKIEKSKNILDMFKGDETINPVWNYVRNDIKLIEAIKDFGYDGLIQIGDIPIYDKSGNVVSDRTKWIKEDEYLTFYPNQVKSAVSKKSYYLNLFDDVRFKKGGYVSL